MTNSALTGNAWGENIGWINLNPATAGVLNDGAGKLSGYAWGKANSSQFSKRRGKV